MQFLRTIRKSRYHNQSWAGDGEMHADPLSDFQTKDNCLSLWVITPGEENLDRILAAIASTRRNAQNLDYALLSPDGVKEVGIYIEQTPGATADVEANQEWHRNASRLSASQLVALAKLVFDNEGKRYRRQAREIKRLVVEGVNRKHLAREDLQLNERTLSKLGI